MSRTSATIARIGGGVLVGGGIEDSVIGDPVGVAANQPLASRIVPAEWAQSGVLLEQWVAGQGRELDVPVRQRHR